jgi:hypothetical protein
VTTPDFDKPTTSPPTGSTPPVPGHNPPPIAPTAPTPGAYPPPSYGQPPQGGYLPPSGYPQPGPQASWGTPPGGGRTGAFGPAAGIALGLVVTAAISAVYGLIVAESNTVVSYLLIIAGVVAGGIFGRARITPVVSAALAALAVGGFGFAATLYGGFGSIAKAASKATGQNISFGTAVSRLPVSTVLDHFRGSVWFFFAIAVIVSGFAGFNGGSVRRRRRTF